LKKQNTLRRFFMSLKSPAWSRKSVHFQDLDKEFFLLYAAEPANAFPLSMKNLQPPHIAAAMKMILF